MTESVDSAAPLLQVEHLSVRLQTPRGPALAVRDVSFGLRRGETLGLIGESGCGKSMMALALLGLLPDSAQTAGSIRLNGQELIGQDDATLSRLRGNRIAMIFQEPMTALNPVHRVGDQIAEPLRLHKNLSKPEAHARAVALMDRVGIANASARADAYPHQFSGGQRQRVTIAMALACEPDLLIADEPTTALDVTVQGQILQLIADLVAERSMAMVLISHDLGVIAQNVQRMVVMYGGTVVESGPTRKIFARQAHPYTQGLFGARPRLGHRRGHRLTTIGGIVPELADLPPACRFADRCPHATAACSQTPPVLEAVAPQHDVACLRHHALQSPESPSA
jgi:peptide/nickel transport system ATP-binding protein